MAIIDDKTLKVQGRVDETLLEKFMGMPSKAENNSEWFFIDYSPSDFALKSKFDLFFLSSNKSILKSNSQIAIENVCDSFGNFIEEGIPKGYKTVCQFAFTNGIPKEFQRLPPLKGWKPSSEEILITSVESFEFNVFPELVHDLIKIIMLDLQENYYRDSHIINKKEFLKQLNNKFHLKDPENLLTFLTLTGMIKQENNEEELVLSK